MTTTLTPGFTPSKEQIEAAELLMVAMAHEAVVRPIVERYQADILARHQFTADEKWSERVAGTGLERIITEGKYSYLLRAADFEVYLADCEVAREAHGLQISRAGNCPLLEAENARIQCEIALMKLWEGHPQFSALASVVRLEQRKQVIDLTLNLFAPYVKDNAHDVLADLGIHPPASKTQANDASPEP